MKHFEALFILALLCILCRTVESGPERRRYQNLVVSGCVCKEFCKQFCTKKINKIKIIWQ